MMSRIVKKTHLPWVSVALLCGLLVSFAWAEELFTATRHPRGEKVDQQLSLSAVNNIVIRIQSRSKGHDFGVVFGPITGSDIGSNGKGRIVTLEDEGYMKEPCWEVERGTAAARGWRPRIRGTTATAAAEGSTVLFERDATYERVFYPEQKSTSKVHVWVGKKSEHAIQLVPGQFVEIANGRQQNLTNNDIKLIRNSSFKQRIKQTLELDAVQSLPEFEKPT